MQIQRALERLGYNHNEVAVYLAMLHLGDSTVTEISRKTVIPRSTTQLAAQALQKKGLANLCMRRKQAVWIAENPNKFLMDLQQKEVFLKQIIPELQAIRHDTKKRSILKYYSGLDKIGAIFDQVLQSQYATNVIGSVSHMSDCLGEALVEDFFEKLFNRHTPTKLLSTTSDFVLQLKNDSKIGLNKVRIYNDEHMVHVVYILFDSTVAIILLGESETVGVVFDDKGFTESITSFFDRLWSESE